MSRDHLERDSFDIQSSLVYLALWARTPRHSLLAGPEPNPHCSVEQHSVHFTMNVHCTLYTAHYTPHTVHSTLQNLHYILCTAHCKLYTAQLTLQIVHCTLFTKHCTLKTTSIPTIISSLSQSCPLLGPHLRLGGV